MASEILNIAKPFIPKKSLGQNFLIDSNITTKICNIDNDISGCSLLEIGPGFGAITESLLKQEPKRLFAIEKDGRFKDNLNKIKKQYPNHFNFVIADALNFDFRPLYSNQLKIFSNLPYNISTKLLVKWLKINISSANWGTLTLMFQKEVANRIISKSGTKNYGRLSLLSELLSDATHKFDVPQNCFKPKPKVISSIIHFKALPTPRYACNFQLLEKIVFLAFNQRRKKIRNSLNSLDININSILEETEISPESRAEQIDLEKYCKLSLKINNST